MNTKDFIREDIATLRAMAAREPRGARRGYDEMADYRLVEHAAAAMREKLATARSRGRGGWWNDKECSIDLLRRLLREHVEKGDMRDVLNLAAMVYVREIADAPPDAGMPLPAYLDEVKKDELYAEAARFVCASGKPSISAIQVQFRTGYNRTARFLEVMEYEGIVSPPDYSGKREVLKVIEGSST